MYQGEGRGSVNTALDKTSIKEMEGIGKWNVY